MAPGGSDNFTADGLAAPSNSTVELINRLIKKNSWLERKVSYRCKHSIGL